MEKKTKAAELLHDLSTMNWKDLVRWGSVTIHGIPGIKLEDLSLLEFYAENLCFNGPVESFKKPNEKISEVLNVYGISIG